MTNEELLVQLRGMEGRLNEWLARIEAKIDAAASADGFCKGHPYSHSFTTPGGGCSTCGRPMRETPQHWGGLNLGGGLTDADFARAEDRKRGKFE